MADRDRFLFAFLAVVPLLACDRGRSPDPAPSFDDLFPEVAQVTLEEAEDDPIVEITSLAPRPGGGFIVVDGPADRVRLYDATGRLERSLGGRGEGPGELQSPTAAAEGASGELHVVQRVGSRHTVFWPADSVSVRRVPGLYGFWLHRLSDGFVMGVGRQDERFAVLSSEGAVRARFGRRDPRVQETPFWVFFVQARATVLGDRIFVSSSFSPKVRVFSTEGDSLYTFGTPPRGWIEPTNPEIGTIASDADRARLEAWARGFTVVTGLAGADGVVLVQYGRHDPRPGEPYHVVRESVDVYSRDGVKLAEGLELPQRILAGGLRIRLLESSPPEGWTISVREWSGEATVDEE